MQTSKPSKPILLVGAGPMALDYAKVLLNLGQEFIVVGRGKKSAQNFKDQIGITPISGGLAKYLSLNTKLPDTAVVAVSEEQLGTAARQLITAGVKSILVEKPGGLDFEDIKKVAQPARKKKASVYVAYNRRFYASVEKAREIIKKDGGVLSIFYDFSEASFRIAPLKKGPGVKDNWFLQNSTHVIDLAFFLAGAPKKISTFTKGSLPWHQKVAIFSGSGVTEKNALFAYHANWISPGRWSVEVMTKKHKLIFKPLEKLQIQEAGSFEVKDFNIDDKLDIDFKPGIYRQVQSFLGNKKQLCTIDEQVKNLKFYEQILKGKS